MLDAPDVMLHLPNSVPDFLNIVSLNVRGGIQQTYAPPARSSPVAPALSLSRFGSAIALAKCVSSSTTLALAIPLRGT